MTKEIRIAHLSDWHATSLTGAGRELFVPKRLSGWASWRFSRRFRHSTTVLDAAIRDVHAQSVDRILVTGDLTHVSLEEEFRTAAGQLASLGSSEHVFLIPGNHDCYVPVEPDRSWDHWASYLHGNPLAELHPEIASCLVGPGIRTGRAPQHADFPTLRIHETLAVVGLCSAIPVPIFRARGELGRHQLERLDRLLGVLGEQGYARVVMLHHPVIATDESPRRALVDADVLREILERRGADLVLHGHKHRRRFHTLSGPAGTIPIIGVPSSSEVGSRPDKLAQYHVYTVRRHPDRHRFEVDAEIRGYDSASGSFIRVDEDLLASASATA